MFEYIYMLAIASQTVGPYGLTFFEVEPMGARGVTLAKQISTFKIFFKFQEKKFHGQRRALS